MTSLDVPSATAQGQLNNAKRNMKLGEGAASCPSPVPRSNP
jgi:hypothetical protein